MRSFCARERINLDKFFFLFLSRRDLFLQKLAKGHRHIDIGLFWLFLSVHNGMLIQVVENAREEDYLCRRHRNAADLAAFLIRNQKPWRRISFHTNANAHDDSNGLSWFARMPVRVSTKASELSFSGSFLVLLVLCHQHIVKAGSKERVHKVQKG